MSVFESSPATPPLLRAELPVLDEAQLAAAAFLARYSGRTLDSCRTDLRGFFQWADNVGLAPLEATRPAADSTPAPPTGGFDRSAPKPGSIASIHTCFEQRSSWPPSTPASRCATSRSPPTMPTHEPPPSTTADDRTTTATRRTPLSPSSPAADSRRSRPWRPDGASPDNDAEYREATRHLSPAIESPDKGVPDDERGVSPKPSVRCGTRFAAAAQTARTSASRLTECSSSQQTAASHAAHA